MIFILVVRTVWKCMLNNAAEYTMLCITQINILFQFYILKSKFGRINKRSRTLSLCSIKMLTVFWRSFQWSTKRMLTIYHQKSPIVFNEEEKNNSIKTGYKIGWIFFYGLWSQKWEWTNSLVPNIRFLASV